MGRLLCIGECMIEMAQIGAGTYKRGFAGDTFNTAWYARQLLPKDWNVGYLSAIGDDAASQEMRAFMSGEGVETSALRTVADRTVGLYMISTKAGERSFSYWRGQSAARLLAEDQNWLETQVMSAGAIHFSGITLAILSPEHREILCQAVSRARDAGALVSFDTNLRPKLWKDQAEMKSGITMGAKAASLVLPSFDEDAELFGDKDPRDTITRYQRLGPKRIVVKNGGDPVTIAEADGQTETVEVKRASEMVDTTAAGDSFAAGLLAALVQNAPLAEATARASALAAQVIQAPGALIPEIFQK
ncbi:sugar kinase [Thalassococcus lentus]|uniref:Sugar kinase n=1 Tax=Thalassococcus lentus TaxID=1210524 RepID=A0ABT4XWJ6_9RHOB|nr:sugar kinase [Thalassococcus lentus]MDA7426178.1 sugar kinase [Thalassococcus lentus]